MWVMINIHADGNTEQAAAVKVRLEEVLSEFGLDGSIRDYGQGSMYTGQYRTAAPVNPEPEVQQAEEQKA